MDPPFAASFGQVAVPGVKAKKSTATRRDFVGKQGTLSAAKKDKLGLAPLRPRRLVADYPGESIGERVALKNAEVRATQAMLSTLMAEEDVQPIIESFVNAVIQSREGGVQGGKRRQMGGDDAWWLEIQDFDLEEQASLAASFMMTYVALAATKTTEAATASWPTVQKFLVDEVVTPVFGDTGKRAGVIALKLGYELFRAPVTGLQLAIGGAGYTANFVAQLVKLFNTWGRDTSTYLLSDDAALQAAKSAVATAKSTATTVGVGVAVANQLGLLPLSAILAAMLFTLQINLSSGEGRAYVITSFYAWYNGQDAATKKAVSDSATEYAKQAKEAAKNAVKSKQAAAAAASIKSAAGAAAKSLGAALSKAGRDGKNAFAAVVSGTDKEGAVPADIPQALEEGAPAAALAAAAVEAESAPESAAMDEAAVGPAAVGAPEAAASGDIGAQFARAVRARSKRVVGPVGGRKTKKVKSKRRVTRRRKAPKYLAAPVFAY